VHRSGDTGVETPTVSKTPDDAPYLPLGNCAFIISHSAKRILVLLSSCTEPYSIAWSTCVTVDFQQSLPEPLSGTAT
jgi:phosphopantetheinyl transferase